MFVTTGMDCLESTPSINLVLKPCVFMVGEMVR